MPLTGYLSVKGIDDGLNYIASTFPTISQIIPLPEQSIEGHSCRAIQIGKGNKPDRRGVFFLGGMHARELVNPDLLLSFAIKLCSAYTSGTGLTFGGKAYDAATIKIVVESLDTYILPLVNPDGRQYVFTSDPMWRKNRSPNGGAACQGVDLNRNFDFLWASGIGTSSNPCDDVYKGSEPFSEPETRNIRYLVDRFPNIIGLVDVHSFSEDILYPWGDDDNQTSNSAMSFTNPAYDGQRGVIGDTTYREYIPERDLQWYQQTGQRMRDAIFAVRGRSYVLKPSVGLYATTGTSNDYCFSLHLVTSSQRKILSYCIETGRRYQDPVRSFQPPYDEAAQIMLEVTPALIEFSLACMCVAESLLAGTILADRLEKMRAFRDEKMLAVPQGRYFANVLQAHNLELISLLAKDEQLRAKALEIAGPVLEIALSSEEHSSRVFDATVLGAVDEYLLMLSRKASPALKKSIKMVRGNLRNFGGRNLVEGLKVSSIPGQVVGPTREKPPVPS